MNQIKLHKKIDELLKKDPLQIEKGDVDFLISKNNDAKLYFFAQADERWTEWLWKNGFLDAIKEKAGNPNGYGYSMPELGYLAKVVAQNPKGVVDIMLSFDTSDKNFNPGAIDRFLWICS